MFPSQHLHQCYCLHCALPPNSFPEILSQTHLLQEAFLITSTHSDQTVLSRSLEHLQLGSYKITLRLLTLFAVLGSTFSQLKSKFFQKRGLFFLVFPNNIFFLSYNGNSNMLTNLQNEFNRTKSGQLEGTMGKSKCTHRW